MCKPAQDMKWRTYSIHDCLQAFDLSNKNGTVDVINFLNIQLCPTLCFRLHYRKPLLPSALLRLPLSEFLQAYTLQFLSRDPEAYANQQK